MITSVLLKEKNVSCPSAEPEMPPTPSASRARLRTANLKTNKS